MTSLELADELEQCGGLLYLGPAHGHAHISPAKIAKMVAALRGKQRVQRATKQSSSPIGHQKAE